MKKHALILTAIFVFLYAATSAFAGVTVTSPTNGSTVGTSVNFVASATTSSCSKGVASMGIYPSPNWLVYVVNGASMNTTINLNPGTYNAVVEEWDYCGGAQTRTVTITVQSGTSVNVTSPKNNSTVSSSVNYVATATSSCSKGVASMGIYAPEGNLVYVSQGASLNTTITLGAGTYTTTVEEWDNCGGAATKHVTITVNSSGTTMSNLQSSGGWEPAAQQPPSYQDCSWCTASGPGTTWAMYQNISNPSMSGKSTQFNLGGTDDYSDVLWDNHLIGDFSSQGLPDTNHTLVPTLTTFTYDVYFWGSNLGLSQALEFDINQFFNDWGYIWGAECRIAGGNEWDIWDNVNTKWVPTGIACNPTNNSWNHVVLQGQRTSDNQVFYQSISLNGKTSVLNTTYPPFYRPGWYGVTINFQTDGDYRQDAYTVYVDKLNFTYQ